MYLIVTTSRLDFSGPSTIQLKIFHSSTKKRTKLPTMGFLFVTGWQRLPIIVWVHLVFGIWYSYRPFMQGCIKLPPPSGGHGRSCQGWKLSGEEGKRNEGKGKGKGEEGKGRGKKVRWREEGRKGREWKEKGRKREREGKAGGKRRKREENRKGRERKKGRLKG